MNNNFVFIQMSGVPGAGKTTVAHALAQRINAVVIDHDVSKSALLEADVPVEIAGRASYFVLDAMARHILKQGHSVIFDSPCFYDELLDRSLKLASESGAAYRYIECVLRDMDALDQRLRTRARMPSQIASVYGSPTIGSGKSHIDESVFREWMDNMKRPDGKHLTLDTSQPLERCIEQAVAYVQR